MRRIFSIGQSSKGEEQDDPVQSEGDTSLETISDKGIKLQPRWKWTTISYKRYADEEPAPLDLPIVSEGSASRKELGHFRRFQAKVARIYCTRAPFEPSLVGHDSVDNSVTALNGLISVRYRRTRQVDHSNAQNEPENVRSIDCCKRSDRNH